MGVNMIGSCIKDEEIVKDAAKKEIVRRYYHEINNYKLGLSDEDAYQKIKLLMKKNFTDLMKAQAKKCAAQLLLILRTTNCA